MGEKRSFVKPQWKDRHREKTVAFLEECEREGTVLEAATHIKTRMDDGTYMSLATRDEMKRLQKESPAVDLVFRRILALAGRTNFGRVRSPEDFAIVDAPYRGADGKTRHPLPKYIPKHIAPHLMAMQAAYKDYFDNGFDFGKHQRPGLILQSAYRSPYYQMGVFARTIVERGTRRTLESVALPGTSQHANYENCAFDITNMGDSYGRPKRGDGSTISFAETMEFDWLLKYAPKYGFWFPFFPNRNRPESPTDENGVLVEPWHIQFVPNAEEKMTEIRDVRGLFKIWRDLMRMKNSIKEAA